MLKQASSPQGLDFAAFFAYPDLSLTRFGKVRPPVLPHFSESGVVKAKSCEEKFMKCTLLYLFLHFASA